MPAFKPIEQRFWSKVKKAGHNACWLWTGAGASYGVIQLPRSRKFITAHVLSYQLHYGPVPQGLKVTHACDNPKCVNPAHLEAKTQKQNMQDAVARGRVGQYSGMKRKLSADQYDEIVSLKGKMKLALVAAKFDVVVQTINRIWSGKTKRPDPNDNVASRAAKARWDKHRASAFARKHR